MELAMWTKAGNFLRGKVYGMVSCPLLPRGNEPLMLKEKKKRPTPKHKINKNQTREGWNRASRAPGKLGL